MQAVLESVLCKSFLTLHYIVHDMDEVDKDIHPFICAEHFKLLWQLNYILKPDIWLFKHCLILKSK